MCGGRTVGRDASDAARGAIESSVGATVGSNTAIAAAVPYDMPPLMDAATPR